MDHQQFKKGKNKIGKTEESFANGDKGDIIVIVNGKRLPMGNFPKKIVKEVVFALVSSLKGGENPEEIEINVKYQK